MKLRTPLVWDGDANLSRSAAYTLRSNATLQPARTDTTVTYGIDCAPTNTANGDIVGVSSLPTSGGTGGTTTVLSAFNGAPRQTNTTGTVTSSYVFRGFSPIISAGGVISTAYGLHLAAQKVGGVTTAYGIRQVGANDLNVFDGPLTAQSLTPSGLTGATAASRYVGATTGGAPTSGTFALGDYVIDQTGRVWICTTAGTPGTWRSLADVYVNPNAPPGTPDTGDLWYDTDDVTGQPGTELSYNQLTSQMNLTNGNASSHLVLDSGTRTYDGTPVMIEFYIPIVQAPAGTNLGSYFSLYDGATDLGIMGEVYTGSGTASIGATVHARRKLTPTAASHNYKIGGWVNGGTGVVYAGTGGGGGTFMPAYLRITRA